MKKYTKLFRIKYNNKLFDIFSDENYQKSFLEVRIKDNKEEYYHINLKDYIYLNSIYNKEPDNIFYDKKYTFKQLIVITGLTGLLITQINVLDTILDYNLKTENQVYKEIVFEQKSYLNEGTNVIISNNEQLDTFGIKQVSFNDVRKTLENNEKIPDKYRNYLKEYIDILEERLPEIDLRVFNENLKTLEFEIISPTDWKKEGVLGYYTLDKNTTTLKEYYDSSKQERETVFHELTHTLNNGVIRIYNNNGQVEYNLIKKFESASGYGHAYTEGINTVLSDYLLTENEELFFDKEFHLHNGYQPISNISYQLLKILDDYSFYDFINEDITTLKIELNKYGLSDSIDLLDTIIKDDNKIEIVELDNLNILEEKILKQRIKKELKQGKNDFEIYELVNKIKLCNENKYTICSEVLNNNENEWMIRINNLQPIVSEQKISLDKETGKIITEEKIETSTPQVRIYHEGNIVINTKIDNLLIYSTVEDGNQVYNFGIIDYKNESAYNILTGQKIETEEINKPVQLTAFLISFYNYDIDINTNLLKSDQLKQFIENYYNSGIDTNIIYGTVNKNLK